MGFVFLKKCTGGFWGGEEEVFGEALTASLRSDCDDDDVAGADPFLLFV
jgi:hypothetical protein